MYTPDFPRLLDGDFRLLTAQVPPSPSEIRQVRSALEVDFPIAYMDVMAQLGAIYLEVKPDVWPKPAEFQSGPRWELMNALILLGMPSAQEKEGFPDMLNITAITTVFRERFRPDLVPFFKWENDRSIYCFGPYARMFRVDYENPTEAVPVEQDFSVFFEEQVRLLVQRKNEYRAKHGTASRKKGGGFWSKVFGRKG
ncbi:Hypothetical protein A7982_00758 [Minicystis rosea]|nr:Hypothetical protein A7982_00758 [Minicystis rosea]